MHGWSSLTELYALNIDVMEVEDSKICEWGRLSQNWLFGHSSKPPRCFDLGAYCDLVFTLTYALVSLIYGLDK